MQKYRAPTGGFSCAGEFYASVRRAGLEQSRDNRLITKTAGHMEEGEDSQGGFLVPEQWAADILHVALEESIVRGNGAIALPCTSDSFKLRTLVDSNRATNFFGGVNFYWIAEAAQKSAAGKITKPALGTIELNPHKLIGSCYSSDELVSDYGVFGQFMEIAFGRALAFVEDDYFINGNGAGQPLGIMGSGAMITVTRNGLAAVNFTDFAHLAERLLPDSWKRAVWMLNADLVDELFEATASAANQATVLDLSTRTLFGRPIIVTEKCAAAGTTGDIILADWGHYVIADREMYIAASREVGLLTDETFWKIVLRVDGQPLMTAAITPRRGANTLSAFVTLTTSS